MGHILATLFTGHVCTVLVQRLCRQYSHHDLEVRWSLVISAALNEASQKSSRAKAWQTTFPLMFVNGRVYSASMGQVIELRRRRKRAPNPVNGKVAPPRRKSNRDSRTREYLTPTEIESLLDAAASGRYGHRDRTLLLVMYRHGLRVSEAIGLRWEQFDLKAGLLAVQRLKQGVPSTHPLRGPELRALRQLRRQWPDSPYLFVSERGGPMTASNVRKLVARAGLEANLPFPVHPHMLRHACGYKLANEGHDTRSLQHYLGHKNIAHTVRYTDLAPDRFKGFWRD
jgi:type 1 fimbriae regulatory protein FimE